MVIENSLVRKRKKKSNFSVFLCSQFQNLTKNDISVGISSSEDDSDNERIDDNFNNLFKKKIVEENDIKLNYELPHTNGGKRFKSRIDSLNADKKHKKFNKITRQENQKSNKLQTNKHYVQNKILIGKKKQNIPRNSLEFISKTSIIDDSISLFTTENDSRHCSFENILKSLADYEDKLVKKNLHKINNSLNNKHDFNSFELMMNSLLTPPYEKEYQNNHKRSDEMTFDEIMNLMLTPDFSTTNRTKPNTQELLLRRHNQAKQIYHVENNIVELLTPERSTEFEKDKEIQNNSPNNAYPSYKHDDFWKINNERTYTNNDNFNKMLIKLFGSQWEIQNSQTNYNLNEIEIGQQNADLSQASNFSPEQDDNFNFTSESFQKIEIQNNGSQNKETLNLSREISTQTSFDDFLPKLPSRLNHNLLNFDTNTDTIFQASDSTDISPVIHETILLQNLPKRKHILEILSNDISILPDGRKVFNNIEKIGSNEWLETAFKAEFRQIVRGEQGIPVFENQNSCILYVNHITKIQVFRQKQESTKICKIQKVEDNSQTENFDYNFISYSVVKPKSKLEKAIDTICQNQQLICYDYDIPTIDKTKIRMKIHNIFEKLYEVFENNQIPILVYNLHNNNYIFENNRVKPAPKKEKKRYSVNLRQFNVFCRVIYVLAKIYTLLKNNTKLTKREIFYQAKKIFKTQQTANYDIARVTNLLGIGPWYLNVVSQSGLVYGDLKLIWASGETTNCKLPATLIPYDLEDLIEIQSSATFILVIEKESVFHKLLEEDFLNKMERPFLMITGKGMPDIGTRLFLNRISRILAVPIFILVDCDIYGIRIMLTYRFGAICSSHLSDDLAVPNAQWLGVLPSEINTFGIKYQNLTKNDKNIIKSALKFIHVEENPKIAEEIKIMQTSNKKASIEDLMKSNTFLSDAYLPMKLFNQNFI